MSLFSGIPDRLKNREAPLAVVGLGYVGLPLAVAMAKTFDVVGFDVNSTRIDQLRSGKDITGEIDGQALANAKIEYSDDPSILSRAPFIAVSVPTPIDSARNPNLGPLLSATQTIAMHIRRGSIVVYESTVYPGVTEEKAVPQLEKFSNMKCGVDFKVGYSPERINPGDKQHTIGNVVKVVSGQDDETAEAVAEVYGAVISAGVHKASSIKVAEAAKVIENIQRDLNIALMNELAVIFNLIGIDSMEVLDAAETKWNFLSFKPGLVGGHCIGVDPYYLTSKAEELGYNPHVILAGRRINDGMGKYIAEQTVKQLAFAGIPAGGAKVAILGVTFKENVPDTRNSRVPDILKELKEYNIEALVHDPIADGSGELKQNGVILCRDDELIGLDCVIFAVGHDVYWEKGPDVIKAMLVERGGVVMDVKSIFNPDSFDDSIKYWRLFQRSFWSLVPRINL